MAQQTQERKDLLEDIILEGIVSEAPRYSKNLGLMIPFSARISRFSDKISDEIQRYIRYNQINVNFSTLLPIFKDDKLRVIGYRHGIAEYRVEEFRPMRIEVLDSKDDIKAIYYQTAGT